MNPSPDCPSRTDETQSLKSLAFWFDPISPYAWLAFDRLPQVLEGLSYRVDYRPVLFAGLLQHHAHKGPAEIGPKRAWTYRTSPGVRTARARRWTCPPPTPSTRCHCCVSRWPAHHRVARPIAAWSRR